MDLTIELRELTHDHTGIALGEAEADHTDVIRFLNIAHHERADHTGAASKHGNTADGQRNPLFNLHFFEFHCKNSPSP